MQENEFICKSPQKMWTILIGQDQRLHFSKLAYIFLSKHRENDVFIIADAGDSWDPWWGRWRCWRRPQEGACWAGWGIWGHSRPQCMDQVSWEGPARNCSLISAKQSCAWLIIESWTVWGVLCKLLWKLEFVSDMRSKFVLSWVS